MTGLLASVRDVAEARAALEGGTDIIDLKEPSQGALGRLPADAIAAILDVLAGRLPVSATIGDIELAPGPVAAAVESMAASGVDFVKIGIFAGDLAATLDALAPIAARGVKLVAVLFADRAPDFALVERFAAAGFRGVMLDTADKSAGPLTYHLSLARLAEFVARAKSRALLTGLAGSLRIDDVPRLLPLAPDYLGFRSALASGTRAGPLDPARVARLAALLRASAASRATAAAGAQSAAASATARSAGTIAAKLR
jgi:uncharacterized protein (UPF0264 family)